MHTLPEPNAEAILRIIKDARLAQAAATAHVLKLVEYGEAHGVYEPEPWHGTLGGYNNHGCRCQDCRDAKAEYMRARRAAIRAIENELAA
jgi:hypothetical protein